MSEDTKVIKLFHNSSNVDKLIFLSKALALGDQDFVITEAFRDVVKSINSGDRKIVIDGPTGVGKSMALAAIETLYRAGERPCFVWSSRVISGPSFDNYVRSIYEEAGNVSGFPHRILQYILPHPSKHICLKFCTESFSRFTYHYKIILSEWMMGFICRRVLPALLAYYRNYLNTFEAISRLRVNFSSNFWHYQI